MSDMIAWLNANSGAVVTLATVITAIAAVVLSATTIVYAWHTWQLAKENRLLRKAGTDPQVVAYVALNQRAWGALDFVIANIGKGAARNVSFKIISGGADFASKQVHLPHVGVNFDFLPQDDKITTGLGMGFDLLDKPALALFKVEVQFDDLNENHYRGEYEINLLPFEGLERLGAPADEQIAKAVQQIEKIFAEWRLSGLKIQPKE